MYHQLIYNLLFQLLLASLATATPISALGHHNESPWQLATGLSLGGFIVLVLDIIVWIEVLKSNRPVSHKLLWCVLVFLFPLVGIIIYWLFSNRAAHNGGGYEPIG